MSEAPGRIKAMNGRVLVHSIRFNGGPWDGRVRDWEWPASRYLVTFQGEYLLHLDTRTATWTPWGDLPD